MPTYAIAVFVTVIVSTIVLLVIFSKTKVLDKKTVLSIGLASLFAAFALPCIYYLLSSIPGSNTGTSAPAFNTAATLIAYVALVFILSLLTPYITSKIGIRKREPAIAEEAAVETGLQAGLQTGPHTALHTPAEAEVSAASGENYLEQIFVNFIGEKNENSNNNENNEEKTVSEENNLEISVDSAENIDKMGIENNIHDREPVTIEECIDEAFRLKEAGDSEGAILYYMYALDKKPKKDLTFWIVLDICVIYKTLGQQGLALDILNSYYDIYGDIMDLSVKEEIERNLTVIQA